MKIISQTCKVIKTVYQKIYKTSARVGYASPVWKRDQFKGLKESCLPWGGLDNARHKYITRRLVRVQCLRKDLYKAVEGPSTTLIVLSMITGSYFRHWMRFTFLIRTRQNSLLMWYSVVCRLDHHRRPEVIILHKHILDTIFHQI